MTAPSNAGNVPLSSDQILRFGAVGRLLGRAALERLATARVVTGGVIPAKKSLVIIGAGSAGPRADNRPMPTRREFLWSTGANQDAGRFTQGHFDLPMRNCTIALDGRVVVKDGVLQGAVSYTHLTLPTSDLV